MDIHISVYGDWQLRASNKKLFCRDVPWHADIDFPFQKVIDSLKVIYNDCKGVLVEILIY